MSYNCNSGAGGCSVRDPDIAKFGSTWWLIHTCPESAASGGFCITNSTDLEHWSNFATSTAVNAAAEGYAPNWVHNPDGTPYLDSGGCPHAFVVINAFQIGETHPTDCSNFTGNWSTTEVIALPTGEMVEDQLDPFPICVSPTGGTCTGTGDTFYLWYVELTPNTTEFINYASGSTLTGQYTLVSPGGNWAGWGSPTQEGPALLKLSDRWRLYFDKIPDAPGDLTDGQINYSDSFDNWATWTAPLPINTLFQAKHGTVIKYP